MKNFLLFLLLSIAHVGLSKNSDLFFIENKGQIVDFQGHNRPDVLFSTHSNGVQLFLTSSGFHYQFYKEILLEDGNSKMVIARVEMKLKGSRIPSSIETEKASVEKLNYFQGQTHGSITGVKSFGRLVYKEIYPGIDWVIYSNGDGFKYDFVIHPGADPSLIQMEYKGQHSLNLTENFSLKLSSSMGEIIEQPVVCFQEGNKVQGKFQLKNNTVGFGINTYDRSKEMVIDPGVVWSTYYGGSANDRNFALVTQGDYFFVGGLTSSLNAISSSASYQDTLAGGQDGFIAKFHKNGNRIWATYLGGSATDYVQNLAIASNGDLLVTGNSASAGLATAGAHKTNVQGTDAFLASFDTSGSVLNWFTYYGGSNEEKGFDVLADSNGDIYLALTTKSNNGANTIATSGAHQTVYGGVQDAALVKFTGSGQRIWGTYFGGAASDNVFQLSLINNDRIAFSGTTGSSAGITMNGFQATYGGGNSDAYIAIFNGQGIQTYGSYFGGSDVEVGYGIEYSTSGLLGCVGQTLSPNMNATVFQTTFGGGQNDAFLYAIDTAGAFVWSTFMGGLSNESLKNICTDSNGNFFVGGNTASPDGIFYNGFQQQPVPNQFGAFNSEGFVAKFTPAGDRIWGSYIGSHELLTVNSADDIWDLQFDNDGSLLVAGSAFGQYGFGVNGFQSVQGGMEDGFIARIDISSIETDTLSTIDYCWGDSIMVNYSSATNFSAGNVFTLDIFADSIMVFSIPVQIGTLSSTASSGQITGVIPDGLTLGNAYHLRVSSSNPPLVGNISTQTFSIGSCLEIGNITLSPSMVFCPGGNFEIPVILNGPDQNFNNQFVARLSDSTGSFVNSTFLGSVSNAINDTAIIANLPINLPTGNNYRIKVWATSPFLASEINTVPISIQNPNFGLSFTIANNYLTTTPFLASFQNTTGNSSLNYYWFFGDGSGTGYQTNNSSLTHQYIFSGTYQVSLLAIDSLTGCRNLRYDLADTVKCTNTNSSCNIVAEILQPGPINACNGGSVDLTCNTASGYSYQWNLNGIPLGGETQPTIHTSIPGYYSVTITDSICSDVSSTVQVTFNQAAVPIPSITQISSIGPCGTGSATLTASSGYNSYLWSNGDTTQSITVNSSGAYFVNGINSNIGCNAQSDTVFLNGSLVPTPSICVVTIDSLVNHNVVVWERPLSLAIDSFFVYRESNQAGVFYKIGAVDYDSIGEFVDVNSNPSIRSYRYKLAVLDTCGGISLPSAAHKTMHLQVSPGIGQSRNLSWTHYEGINFPSYEVFSGDSTQGQLTLLQTLPSSNNTFTDLNPIDSLQTHYYVRIILPSPCDPSRAPRTRSSSNTSGNLTLFVADTLNPVGVSKFPNFEARDIQILPNPNNGNFTLSILGGQINEPIVYWVEDILGNLLIAPLSITSAKTSVEMKPAAGVYFLRVKGSNWQEHRRIVISE